MTNKANGYYTESFPAPGLRQIFRHITGNDSKGQSVFLQSDNGEHYRLMVEKQAVANILYSTRETPVDLNNDVDIQKAKETEVRVVPQHLHSTTVLSCLSSRMNVQYLPFGLRRTIIASFPLRKRLHSPYDRLWPWRRIADASSTDD